MYNIFETPDTRDNATISQFEFNYLKSSYSKELIKIEEYYHNRVYSVKNNTLLVSLLNNLTAPMSLATDRYAVNTEARAPYIGNVMGFTSDIAKGTIFNGPFYGPDSSEIILNNNEYFNPNYAEKNWKNICAVRPLLHPKNDLGLLLPNGRKFSSGNGLSTISINIPLLAMQYRSFCLDQFIKFKETNSLLGATHFVHMYVLPNMLYAQTDISLMNRLLALYYGAPKSEVYFKHPFMIHDYNDKVDNVLDKLIEVYKNSGTKYSIILKSIPSITDNNMQTSLLMPDITPTTQALWALLFSRLEYIKFLIDIGGSNSISANMTEINYLKLLIKRVRSAGTYSSVIKDKMLLGTYTEIMQEIMEI
jgi:hypothetical protein